MKILYNLKKQGGITGISSAVQSLAPT